MFNRFAKIAVTAGSAAAIAVSSMPKPASASEGSTLTTILGAAAVAGGIVLYNNYEHKKQQANTVVGYTPSGGTVYADGRIVTQSGQTIYPDQNGQYPWAQYAYNRGGNNGDGYRGGDVRYGDRWHR
jgi:hypothetical protein